jgi:hypothetical protein
MQLALYRNDNFGEQLHVLYRIRTVMLPDPDDMARASEHWRWHGCVIVSALGGLHPANHRFAARDGWRDGPDMEGRSV